ncbi:MAG: FtsX-like permease family protein [Caldilineaceae bacterium]
MLISPRWRKIMRDLSSNRTRTVLVVASIAVGIFAVGTVQQLRTVILDEMSAIYAQSGSAQANIIVPNMDDATLESVRRMPEVAAAEGRGQLGVEVAVASGQWESLNITVIDDFANNTVNYLLPAGPLPNNPGFDGTRTNWPAKDEIVLERASLDANLLPDGLQEGDQLLVRNEAGRERLLTVAGAIYDPNGFPAAFTGSASGYVTRETFERLGGSSTSSQLVIRVNGTPAELLDVDYITEIANKVQDKLERGGLAVQQLFVPEPGQLLFQNIFDSIALLLTPLGLLALFLSGFLVINTISALMAQQTRQIGVMKTVGARRRQIIRMYLGGVVIYSVLALLVAIPLTMVVTGAVLQFAGSFINITFPTFSLPLSVFLIQLSVGLLIPLLAALWPVLRGARVTVREALADTGVGTFSVDLLDRILAGIRGLSRPAQLSLRNTFRRRARLALTLIMLVLGGMLFMTIGSVRASLTSLIEAGLSYNNYDIQISFGGTYRIERIEQTLMAVPGVAEVETWTQTLGTRQRPDGTESNTITAIGLPATSDMVKPTLVGGRWLLPDDRNALVVSTRLLTDDSDINVGDTVLMDFYGQEAEWVVVGIVQVLSGPPNFVPVYINYPYFSRYTNNVMRGDSTQVKIVHNGDYTPESVATAVQERLEAEGYNVGQVFTINLIRRISGGIFDVIVYLLSAMGVLIAIVGALGLTGTMSTNVLERTREIGVMRAIGATDGAIQRIVIVEGVLIGLISWLIGAALAYPAGAAISSGVGQVLFNTDLPYTFSSTGLVTWFVIVSILATVASFLPARNASKLTVREVLAYE